MRFREATAADADNIANLHAESWRRAYRGEYSDDYLDCPVYDERRAAWNGRYVPQRAPDMFTVVAEDETTGELLGFACSFGAKDPTFGTLVDNLHVHASAEGQSVGRRLMAASAAWARRMHPTVGFHVYVLETNARARRFYEHIGGTVKGDTIQETPGGPVRAVRYGWDTFDVLEAVEPELAVPEIRT
eukprot:m.234358 g.234358  ORF g.234358 m.234358 type:complete len:188 (-) comp43512_c0_seq1:70-633(-)